MEVLVKEGVKCWEDVWVLVVGCDEVRVIERCGVMKEGVDGVCDEVVGVRVYGMVELILNVVEGMDDDLGLLESKVEWVVCVVGKEGILRDYGGERCIGEEVGMEDKEVGMWLEVDGVMLGREEVWGGDKYECG